MRHGRHADWAVRHLWFFELTALFSNATMLRWPRLDAEAVSFDVAFALTFKVGRTLRPLTQLDRKVVAKNIVDHLQLSNWVIERGPPGANTSPENWPKRPDQLLL
jgi:hypothetical protein